MRRPKRGRHYNHLRESLKHDKGSTPFPPPPTSSTVRITTFIRLLAGGHLDSTSHMVLIGHIVKIIFWLVTYPYWYLPLDRVSIGQDVKCNNSGFWLVTYQYIPKQCSDDLFACKEHNSLLLCHKVLNVPIFVLTQTGFWLVRSNQSQFTVFQ